MARIKRFRVQGVVPVESWADVFRSFVIPSTKMELRSQKLGIVFEMETGPESTLSEQDQAIKSMVEAAKQLGLDFKIEKG